MDKLKPALFLNSDSGHPTSGKELTIKLMQIATWIESAGFAVTGFSTSIGTFFG